MNYKLEINDDAKKQLKSLDRSIQRQILKKFNDLSLNPNLGKPLTGWLRNFRSIHIGKFRIIYKIDKDNEILVTKIGHRKNVYDFVLKFKDN
ncbi:MAG: type II toxin-antitoxin system RelE/ParE family toxin [archaeon]